MLKTRALEILTGVSQGERRQASAPTNLHVISGEVGGTSENGKALVRIDGLVFSGTNSQYVEVDTLGGLEEGDIATILLTGENGHSMTPMAVGSVGSIDRITVRIAAIEADYIKVEQLDAAEARIEDLEADHVSISDLNAASARIGTIEADYLKTADMTAETARVDNLLADKASVDDLNAATARIGDLEADHVSVSDFEAEQANIDTLQANTADIATIRANSAKVANLTAAELEADHATVGSLDTNYAQINLANVDNAWIQNGTVKDGAITNAMINSVSANKLTAGTIDASNITVTNLNADNITTGTINGQRIGEGSLSLSKLEDDVYTETEVNNIVDNLQSQIDGAIETWTGTAVPTLQNAPAVNWGTGAVKDTHVGDVYFVVNSQSQQNGYNYRFTKTGTTYSWQLIKDNDVTNALQRITAAEGKITTFDSDISTLKTDTGTLKTRATNLETRMSDAENDILDKVDTTIFNEVSDTVDQHSQTITQMSQTLSNKADGSTVTSLTQRVSKNEQDISGINTTIGELSTTVESKADGSTVESVSNRLNTVSNTVDGHTQTLTSVQNTLSTKADNSTVSTLTTKVNNVSDTVDGHTSQLSSITSTQTTMQTTLDKTVKSSIQLWYSKANTTAPSKPTSKVTSTSTSGNAWRIVVPAYNANYPHYYYCWQYEYVDGTYGWSAVVRDIAMGESQATARTADTNASTAVTTANTASTNASTALTTANTANTNASEAKTAATTASTTASEAKTTAETAASDASTAKTNAASAVTTANSANTTATNAQSTANANIKSSVQLWFAKANSTAPSKPTSVVSTSNANTTNAWNLVVPVWNSSYPHYFYCYQQQKGDGTYQWTDVVYDRATSEAQQLANTTSTSLRTLQTDYATFKQTTQQFESTVGTTYATKTELKGATDDITELESRVSNNETSISNNSTAIALKANSSDVYTKTAVDGKITQEVTDRNAAITAKANEITSSVSETYTTKTEASLMANPNLTPYFSRDKGDVYNASTNPSGYWKNISANYITALDDGWVHINASNSGTSNIFVTYFTSKTSVPKDLVASTKYTFLVETRGVTKSGNVVIYASHHYGSELHAFASSAGYSVSGEESKYFTVTSASDLSSIACFTRGYVQVPSNGSVDMDIRISLYEGEYSGPYKPYVDQTLSNRVKSAETSIEQNAEAITLRATKAETTVGGRNLLSGDAAMLHKWTNVMPSAVTVTGEEYEALYHMIKGVGGWENVYSPAIQIETGKTYTVSMDYSVESDYTPYGSGEQQMFGLEVCTQSGSTQNNFSTLLAKITFGVNAKERTRGSATFTATTDTIYLHLDGGYIRDGMENKDFIVSRLKLEEGSTATAYMPPYSDYATAAELKVANDNINLKVSKNDVINQINVSTEGAKIDADRVEINGTAIFSAIKSSADAAYDAKGAAATVQDNLDNLEVGGRNLLPQTQNWGKVSTSNGTGTITSDMKAGCQILKFVWGSGNADVFFTGKWTRPLEANAWYTLSFWARADAAIDLRNYLWSPAVVDEGRNSVGRTTSSSDGAILTPITTSWKRYWIAWHVKAGSSLPNNVIIGRLLSAGTVYFAGAKFEKGNKATDWTPAPEDVDASITNAVNDISVGGRNLLQDSDQVLVNGSVLDTKTLFACFLWSTPAKSYTGYKQIMPNTNVNSAGRFILTFEAMDISQEYWCIKHNGTKHDYMLYFKNSVDVEQGDVLTLSFDVAKFNPSVANGLEIKNFKLEKGNKATDWTPAPEDTVKRTQRIWYRKSASGAPSTPGTASSNWVTKADDGNDAWTKMHIAISSTHKYIYTCEQYEMADGTVGYTSVLLDNTITVIDGGNIITGSVTANKLNASDINASKKLTVGAMTDDAASTILNSNVQVGGRNLLAKTKELTSGVWVYDGATRGDNVALIATSDKRIYQLPSVGYWTWTTGTTYVVSVDARADASTVLEINAVGASSRKQFTIGTSWERYAFVFTATTVNTGSLSFYRMGSANTTLYLRRPKLEIGNKATDWTPAPEDVDADISDAAKTATNFLTTVDSTGLFVHRANNTNSGVKITDDIDIVRGGVSKLHIDDDSVDINDSEAQNIVSFAGSTEEPSEANGYKTIRDASVVMGDSTLGTAIFNARLVDGEATKTTYEYKGATATIEAFRDIGESVDLIARIVAQVVKEYNTSRSDFDIISTVMMQSDYLDVTTRTGNQIKRVNMDSIRRLVGCRIDIAYAALNVNANSGGNMVFNWVQGGFADSNYIVSISRMSHLNFYNYVEFTVVSRTPSSITIAYWNSSSVTITGLQVGLIGVDSRYGSMLS